MILALSSCHDDIPIYDSYETTTQTLFVYMPWTGSTTSSAYALNNFFDENIAGMKKYVDTSKGIKGTDIIVFKANSQSQSVMFRTRNRSKKVPNLYYVGAGTLPGIGLPMCLIGAQLTYKRITGNRRRGPLTKEDI